MLHTITGNKMAGNTSIGEKYRPEYSDNTSSIHQTKKQPKFKSWTLSQVYRVC